MIWLIDKLNKLAAHLLYKIANVIEVEIFWVLFKNDVICEVEYVRNDNDSISFNIITDNSLSYEQNLKVCELIGKLNDEQYANICINFQLWNEKDYKDMYGVN